jgi:hypothetical protein
LDIRFVWFADDVVKATVRSDVTSFDGTARPR